MPSVLRRFGVLTLVSALAVLPLGPAYADGAARAQADAQHSQARLHRLQAQLRTALARYELALGSLQDQVSAGVQADDAARASAAALRAAQDARTERLRALYMDGGRLGVFASLLAARTPQDLALRVATAQRLVEGTDAGVEQAQAAATLVRVRQAATDRRISTALSFADDVTDRANDVDRLVREGRAELAHLDARARKLAARDLARAAASAASTAGNAAAHAGVVPIPGAYLSYYQGAARTCPGLPWTLLAAVGQVESGHGRNNGPSSAGAVGPMQFRPRTFDAFAVDGNHDGRRDPWDPADAIYTAAHFLCSYGAGSPAGVQRALLHYNNAQWYVDLVLAVRQKIAATY
ncbi:MAG: lytic murein transglycosylase [Actinomycetales bacterium]